MKIKCQPDEFRVEELLRLKLKPRGAYSVYRLEKRNWNTLDVIRQLQLKYRFPAVARAGLKDRHSYSIQYLSIPGKGPKRVTSDNYSLTLVGMADEPVSRDLLVGNRFDIVIRCLDEAELNRLQEALPLVRQFGFVNYYDEQRFGSARHKQGFIAQKLILGHYNGALKLYLATPSGADDSNTKRQKRAILANWGNWQKCWEVANSENKPIFKYLIEHPKDFAGAVRKIPRTMLELFINAYQGWLWNEITKALIEEMGLARLFAFYGFGKLLFYEKLSHSEMRYLGRLVIPAPGPRAEFKSERVARVFQEVLRREGLEMERMKLKVRLRGLFFKPYERLVVVRAEHLAAAEPEPDELYPGKSKVRVSFVLPAGAYATILLKRLFALPV
ncbi:MAG: tRNA pseudouridine(13) synthase TruD [candidate division WOR-3 bacterium]|jgi:tRNA pseudouridine13 synthase|nr:tRNA pseudouridine(13) synthase TruD [candidate division WOR-3 bacterium]MDH7518403.1 tRNA pseudouridine(13) synthase TruD [bacterium]